MKIGGVIYSTITVFALFINHDSVITTKNRWRIKTNKQEIKSVIR